MWPRAFAAVLSLVGAIWVPGFAASARQPEQIRYGCDDLVVVGRFQNRRDYQHVEIEDDILGHGWMTAEVNVITVVAGLRSRPPIVAKYFGHTYFREDRDFLLVLYPEPGADRFSVRSARLLEGDDDAELASRCVEEWSQGES